MNIVYVLLGTVIGAGFISGAEINLFFNMTGTLGILGIIISSIILGIVIYLSINSNCSSYVELIKNNIKNKIIIKLIELTVNSFLIVSYFIMIAGLSSFLNEEIGTNYLFSSIISVVITFIVIQGDIKRIEKFNKMFIPILIILILGMVTLINKDAVISLKENIILNKNFIIMGITYASYNAISLIPVALKLKENVELSLKKKLIISSIFAVTTMICGIIIFLLIESKKESVTADIPMLQIIKNNHILLKILVKGAIIFSILSTAVSVQYAAVTNISTQKEKYLKIIILMNIIAIAVSRFGFQTLINIFYPVFGVIGIINYIILLKNYIKCSKIEAKY